VEEIEAASSTATRPRRRSRVIAWLSWIYAAQIIAAWLFLRLEGDRSWFGAIAIFSPRWIVLLPLIPLLPLALALNQRCISILSIATAAALVWVMGLCLPWRAWLAPVPSALAIRVLTCNVHGHALHSQQLADLIAAVHPDVVVLQEWTPPYESSIFDDGDWNVITTGEQCLATRFHVRSAREFQKGYAVHYVLETSAGTFNLFSVHLASPHPPLAAALAGLPGGKTDLEKNVSEREEQSLHLARVTESVSGPLLIAGDFNLCPDSPIFRQNFRQLDDAFGAAGFGFGWTYRVRWTAARIDHILATSQWTCRKCWLGNSVGSPHRPLIADFSLSKAP